MVGYKYKLRHHRIGCTEYVIAKPARVYQSRSLRESTSQYLGGEGLTNTVLGSWKIACERRRVRVDF